MSSSKASQNVIKNESTQPPTYSEEKKRKDKKTDASTGAKAAGIRALSSQLVAFYFRAPVKAFFRSRVEYVAIQNLVASWWLIKVSYMVRIKQSV